jgi:hypothetical protein
MEVQSKLISVDQFTHHFVARLAQSGPSPHALLDDAHDGLMDGTFGGLGWGKHF